MIARLTVRITMNTPRVKESMHRYRQTRDFGTRELVKTGKGKCFRPEYIPIKDPAFLERIAAKRRSESERSFSKEKYGYRRNTMSTRNNRLSRGKNRPHASSSTAFRRIFE